MDRPTLIGQAEPVGDAPPALVRPHESEQDREYPWESHGSLRSRVLDYDPVFKTRTVYWYDESTREQFLTEHTDISEILERNQALRNQTDENTRWTPRRDGEESHHTHVFTVPMALVPDIWEKTHFGKDRKAVTKWLRAPENKPFLVRHVKVGI